MIPLKDENPTTTTPVVTVILIAACVLVWVGVQQGGQREDNDAFTFQTAAIPCEVVQGRPLTVEEVRDTVQFDDETACTSSPVTEPFFPDKNEYLALLYSMFMHGSWIHLLGNMLFLWVFGNNIEDRLGTAKYLGFYVVAGVVATAAHIAVQPASTVPLVGASGAIAGVMGMYLVLFPNVQIRSLILLGFFILFRDISAKWLLGIWLVSQFFVNPNEGVAWMAHVGGFVFGVMAGLLLRATGEPEPQPYPSPTPWRY
ncbi:MAG TPA: rhomboid family intramembrane serine protease [Acidimicrobiales bacterium]|nr:rhomboid family intramembrane serine protease [Acidimicrobiales bacterium]